MLKVVGASWLQTRISTYILVAVGLLGIGAIVLGEFGGIEKDGTYSATVFWNHKGGYRIDFWGQGNDLTGVPKGAARAYYKTRIEETGWSTVEIESSPTYPDAVQAYAAGLLEGSLTWQVIHHHWYNTIGTVCSSSSSNEERCERIRQSLRDNTAFIRERANLLASEDPFWHMIRLFYAQLDGMEAGWRFAVRRSRRSVEIDAEDFLWLAMASDLPEAATAHFPFPDADALPISNELPEVPGSNPPVSNDNGGSSVIFLKSLARTAEGLDPILAIAQNTVAPYSNMLRLLKRYTFGYHVSGNRHSPRVPTRSIFMSSYPGAISSHDEYYVARRGSVDDDGEDDDDLVIFAGIPLRDSPEPNLHAAADSNDQEDQRKKEKQLDSALQSVLSPARIMAANRLATEPNAWSGFLARGNPSQKSQQRKKRSNGLQWLSVRPKDFSVWLIEQHPSMIRAADYTAVFRKDGFVFCDGRSMFSSNENDSKEHSLLNTDLTQFFADNITSVEAIRKLMRGTSRYSERQEDAKQEPDLDTAASASVSMSTTTTARSVENTESRDFSHALDPLGKFVFRGDLEAVPVAIGVIDTKISIATAGGLESFEATSGPPFGHQTNTGSITSPFLWAKYFSNISHIGQPEKFQFQSIVPQWIWL